ncbi:MAG: T9SS type A sorting domain-containing protein [Bacteroidetes bacterium]|nr:T9SS type A sorting domain-containing protein [Bacteroidota bacterium]
MKTQKLLTALAITAGSFISEINAQATVAWKQQFSGAALHDISEEEDGYPNLRSSAFDTLSNSLYYLSSAPKSSSVDFDPNPSIKASIKGGSNVYKHYNNGEIYQEIDLGTPVISAFNSTNGKYRWANKFEPIGANSYINPTKIEAIGKASGLYFSAQFKGKAKYKSNTFTSVSNATNSNSCDVLFGRLDQNGNILKSASIVPVNPSNKNGTIYTEEMTVNNSGDLIAAISYRNYDNNIGSSFKIVGTNMTKTITMAEGDIALVRFDGSLKYITHTIIKPSGNYIWINDLKSDASKNILVGLHTYRHNNNSLTLSSGQIVTSPSTSDSVGSQKNYIVKLPAMLTNINLVKEIDKEAFTIETDKLGNILVTSILGAGDKWEIQNNTIQADTNEVVQVVVKYDKNGNYKNHLAIARQQSRYVDAWDTYMDGNNNLYISYGINVAAGDFWLYERQFMSKIRTSGTTMTEIWKNSIMANGNYYHVTASSIYGHKNAVFLTTLLQPHANSYKILVSNPLQQIKVNGDKSVSCMIQYNLSGAALSPEEQTEENNSNAYKTSFEEVSSSLVVYPNPTKDDVNVQITLSENEQATITLFNYNGVAVKNVVTTEVETKLNIAELPAGMYFVEVISNSGKEVKKLIKQ